MTDRNMNLPSEKEELDQRELEMLLGHGQRQGYLTGRDIVDCIPDTEYDQDLFDQALAAVVEAGIPYLGDGGIGEDPQEDYPGDNNPGEAEDLDDGDLLDEFTGFIPGDAPDLGSVETDDMLKLYVKEATSVPLLSAEEEVELAQRIELCRLAQEELAAGRVRPNRQKELRRIIASGRSAREHLIRANSRLVISVARKYVNRGIPFLDLIQEGNIGLMRAIRNYDHRRGFKFSTYATWWIRQAISRAVAEQSRTIRLPEYLSGQINRMLRAHGQLQHQLGRAPSREELAENLGVPGEKVDQMMDVVRQPISLQKPIGEDEDEVLGDIIADVGAPDPEESALQVLMNEDLRRQIETLPPREQQVLQMRYGLAGDEPLTLSEVGRRMGITRERARQLEAQAIDRLRNPDKPRKRRSRAE